MKYAVFLFLFTFLVSCNPDSSNTSDPIELVDYTAINEAQITEYLAANDLVSQKTESGLHYIIENQGDGAQPTATSSVTVVYRGYFLDGTVFDPGTPEGLTIGLDQVIAGWTQGIPLFNEDGNGVLLIPAHLAYGSFDFNGIPAGSVLVFDINLISVN
jgi:FKBP-type peptidyl-prolyl cis-trans isomerase FkpA